MLVVLALGLSAVLTPSLGRLGLRWGLIDRPSGDGLKIHSEPKPVTGGIGIVVAVLVGAAAANDAIALWPTLGILLLLLVGVVDDVRPLPPMLRVVAQVGAGAMLAIGGATFAPLGELAPLAVVLAVLFLTNAMNIVDGQDGLATGLALLASCGLAAIAATHGSVDSIGPALIGALIGFLLWNRPPARVFLGDGGAYAVGCMLVLLATESSQSWEGALGTITCLSVFGLEVASTVLRRASVNASLLSGDRAHTYDLLAERLQDRGRATAGMWAAGAIAAVLGFFVAQAPLQVGIAVAAAILVGGLVAILRLSRNRLRPPR